MLRLILDPIRRWWWVLTLVFLAAAVSTFGGVPFLLAPAGVILLFADAQGGLIRTTAPLPVSRSAQARARWIFAVPLIVLLGAVAMLLGATLREIVLPKSRGVGLAMVFQIWFGFGYASLSFIGLSFAGSRPPENWREYLTQLFVGLCWGLSLVSIMWRLPQVPEDVTYWKQWHWNLFTAVPFVVGGSYFCLEEFIRRRSIPSGIKTLPPARTQKNESEGAIGVPLYFLTIPARVIVFTLVMTLIQWTTIQLVSGGWTMYISNLAVFQFALFSVFISTFVTEQVSIRALRALPISSHALTRLLLSGPCLSATGVAILLIPDAIYNGFPAEAAWRIVDTILGTAGGGALCLALILRYTGAARLGMIFAAAVSAPFAILFLPETPGAATAFGVLTGTAGYFLLYHSLRHSSAIYQPRKLIGMGLAQSQ